MRDFKQEIDRCTDPSALMQILDALSAEIDLANEAPYEDELFLERTHDLELLLRYGETKLELLLA